MQYLPINTVRHRRVEPHRQRVNGNMSRPVVMYDVEMGTAIERTNHDKTSKYNPAPLAPINHLPRAKKMCLVHGRRTYVRTRGSLRSPGRVSLTHHDGAHDLAPHVRHVPQHELELPHKAKLHVVPPRAGVLVLVYRGPLRVVARPVRS